MKKFLLFAAAAMMVTMLSVPMAYAAPSPTEPDRQIEDLDVPLSEVEKVEDLGVPLTQLEDLDVPLSELEDLGVPLAETEDLGIPLSQLEDLDVPLAELEDLGVPLAYIPSPQTGVSGLDGMEALALAAIAFAVSGAAILAKAGKQAGPVR